MAHTIGNRRHALILWAWWNERDRREDYDHTPPKGFEQVGQGGQRTAFLHIASSVVYKVQHQDRWADDGQGYCSETELRNARALARLVRSRGYMWSALVRIPKVSGMSVLKPSGENALIIAMEYVKGSNPGRNTHQAMQDLRKTGLSDLHFKNVILEGETGHLVPIDLGAPVSRLGKPLVLA